MLGYALCEVDNILSINICRITLRSQGRIQVDKTHSVLTLSRRHLFSLMAPMHPTKPMIITKVPVMINRLAADREGKEEERVAKFP